MLDFDNNLSKDMSTNGTYHIDWWFVYRFSIEECVLFNDNPNCGFNIAFATSLNKDLVTYII